MRMPREPRREGPAARRHAYSAAFKLQVVREALLRPASNRIKPTCRDHPGIEPVQLRKWIRNLSALEEAVPSAKCLSRSTRGSPQYRTSEEDYSSLDESNNIIDDCRLYANECGGHFRVVQPTPLRPAFVGAKRAMGEITTQPTPLRPAFVNAKRAMGEVIATQWHPGHDPNRHGQVAYEAFPGWPNVLVLATGSVCIPMPMDSRYSQGQNAQSQHNQPVHNIYPPAHACAQPQHANQNAPAPAVQAQAAPTGFVKQPPVQRTPLGRAVTLPQTGQTREPPTPMMSGSDSAFNCVGLTKSPSLRAREEQACAAQELMLLSLARPPTAYV